MKRQKHAPRHNPAPPEVGARFKDSRGSSYYVRAVVDVEESELYGALYQVVLRRYSPRKGWCYVVESAFAFRAGLYKPV